MARLGMVPGGLLDPGRVIAPEALAASPVADLNAVDDALASALSAKLQVRPSATSAAAGLPGG